jgi:hypothetical protein
MSDETTLKNLEATLAGNTSALARLNAHLQVLLPTFIEEFGEAQAAESTTTTLVIESTRDTFFRCTGLLVVLPLGTVAASLQLGGSDVPPIPLQNTTTLYTPIQRILRSTDPRKLTFTTGADNAGQALVWLWGDAVPSYGKL